MSTRAIDDPNRDARGPVLAEQLSSDRHQIQGPSFHEWGVLGDGGIWNNLATQAIREEETDRGLPIICMNASAPGKVAGPALMRVPFVSLGMWMVRTMTVLNRNTVEPRVLAIQRDLDRRVESSTPPSAQDPLTIVADMRSVPQFRLAMRRLTRPQPVAVAAGQPRPDIGASELDDLTGSAWWTELAAMDDGADVTIGTKLTRVRGQEALRLLVRGYANTWMASLLVQPLRPEELALTGVAARIQAIAGLP